MIRPLKITIATLFFTLSLQCAEAQSQVVFKNGKGIEANWIGETKTTIQVQLPNSQNVVEIRKSQLIKVVQEGGLQQYYNKPRKYYPKQYLVNYTDSADHYQLGQQYAYLNYNGVITGLISLLLPYGLVVAGVMELTSSNPKNCAKLVPEKYHEDTPYLEGFAARKDRANANAAWVGCLAGLGVILGVTSLAN